MNPQEVLEYAKNNDAKQLDLRFTDIPSLQHHVSYNYGKSTIGNRSDIERVPIENLQAFYKKYYQPDNVVLIVAGKFEEAKALSLAEKHLGSIPKPARKLDATYTEEPPQDGE